VTQNWIGRLLDDYSIVESLVNGRFSTTNLGRQESPDFVKERAFKIAKNPAEISLNPTSITQTHAITLDGDNLKFVRPNANQLLRHQHNLMLRTFNPDFVVSRRLSDTGGNWFYSVEYWGENCSFRNEIDTSSCKVVMFWELIGGLADKSERVSFHHHGDLKPENILWTRSGAKVIDPGFFGEIDCAEGELLDVMVTTPLYYPFLKPDDIFAMGLILWEAVCGQHPLRGTAFSTIFETFIRAPGEKIEVNATRAPLVDASVQRWIDSHPQPTRTFLEPLLALERPSTSQPDMPPLLEQVLLKGLRMSLSSDGKIVAGNGYANWKEFEQDINKLFHLAADKAVKHPFLS